jgi:transposase
MTKRQQVIALLALGWSVRRIERETQVRRETVSRYARSADPNPAKVFPGSSLPPRSAAGRYDATIREKLGQGLTAQRIWQDLVEDFGYGYSYESVKRYVRRLEPERRAGGVMTSLPGEEAQVDFFQGPPTLDGRTGQWLGRGSSG